MKALLLLLTGCLHAVPTVPASRPAPTSIDLGAAGPIRVETVVSATWAVPLQGLLDLHDPRTDGLQKGKHPIVLPVHVLVHPTAGVFVIDTGMPEGPDPTRGLTRMFTSKVEVQETLASLLARQNAPLAGVLLTHAHLDHVLGLPDVPDGVPIYAGPGEDRSEGLAGALVFPTFRRALGDRPLTVWDFDGANALGPVERAIDIVGDGSIWALSVPGHTPGSTAYLARTPDGPVLFTGDCSHTRWGWDHDVIPGTYTADPDANAVSLAALRALAAATPGLRVEVGHER